MKNHSMRPDPHPFNKRRLWNGLLGVMVETGAVVVLMLLALAFLRLLEVFY